MQQEAALTMAGEDYAAAHAVHYKTKNLEEALGLYEAIIAAYPDTDEAKYSRTQIQNIAKSVVPKQELLDAELAMTRAHLKQ